MQCLKVLILTRKPSPIILKPGIIRSILLREHQMEKKTALRPRPRHGLRTGRPCKVQDCDRTVRKQPMLSRPPVSFSHVGALHLLIYQVSCQLVTIRPFQEEISRVISIYIGDGGARQLNLSSKERNVLLEALSKTTHPSAFRSVISTVEWSLRHQAHPNFIRWTICNGNRPRVLFARGLGIGGIVGGLAAAIVLTLSSVGRGWRALSAIGFFIGIATLFAAIKGMCVVSSIC